MDLHTVSPTNLFELNNLLPSKLQLIYTKTVLFALLSYAKYKVLVYFSTLLSRIT